MQSKIFSRLFKYLLCFSVFALIFNPFYLFHENSIGDDASYIAHTYTMAYDGDLNYCNEVAFDSAGCHLQKTRTAPSHPSGIGLLNMPLVGLFSVVDKMNDHAVVSDRFQYVGSFGFLAMFLSVIFFFFLGMWLYKEAIRSLSSKLPSWFIFLLLSSFGILFYVLQRFTMNHVHEFFLGAIMFWLSVRLSRSNTTREIALVSFLIPVIAALCYLLRPVNIIAAVFPFVIVALLADQEFYKRRIKQVILYGVLGLLVSLVLVGIFNFTLYGFYFPNSMEMYGYEVVKTPDGLINKIKLIFYLLPGIRHILFSSEFGLLFTSPLLFVGLALLVYQIFRLKGIKKWMLLIIYLLVMGIPTAIILFLQEEACAYGFRYLFVLAPLAVMGVVYFFERAGASVQRLLKFVLVPLMVFGILGQVFFMATPELSSREQVNVFGRLHPYSANGYNTSLVKGLVDPDTWKNLFAKRLPGFLYILSTSEASVQQKINEGNMRFEKVKTYQEQIKKAGIPYVLFVILFSLLFPYIVFRWIFDAKPHTNKIEA